MSDQSSRNYVYLSAVGKKYNEERLELKIKKESKVTDFILIFIPGEQEAIVICNNEEDVAKITKIRSRSVQFQRLPLHLWPSNYEKLEIREEIPRRLLQDLPRMHINVHVNIKGNQVTSLIRAPTILQCKYVAYAINKMSRLDERTIEVTNRDVWNTTEILKSDDIKALKRLGITTRSDGYIVTFTGKSRNEDVDSHILVIESCIKYLQGMHIEQVSLNEKKSRQIGEWCHEIESEQNKRCCAFNGKREVFVFDYKSSDCSQIVHKLLLRDGQRRLTRRANRELHASLDGII